MGIFKKNKNNKENNIKDLRFKAPSTSFDNMAYVIVRDSSDEQIFEICDTILGGKAVLANFTKISTSDANMMMLFISGVIYATNGKCFKLGNRMYLFAKKEELEDGSINQYYEDSR